MTATYDCFKAAYPDRVGETGYIAELQGYSISVFHLGSCWKWQLQHDDRFVTSGHTRIDADVAWRAACDALDAERRLAAEPGGGAFDKRMADYRPT